MAPAKFLIFSLLVGVPLQIYMQNHSLVEAQSMARNGQIKEEVLFNDGQVKIFRRFDQNGKLVLNQSDELDQQCSDTIEGKAK